MSHLLEHIARKIRAHACRWVGLDEVTVPSAAATDEEVEVWNDHRYMGELVDAFLELARETAANIACPLIESMLARPTIEDQDVEFRWAS